MCMTGGTDFRCNSPTCQGRSTPQVQAERRNNRNYRRDLASAVAARGDFVLAKQVMKSKFTAMPELTQAAGLDPHSISSASLPGQVKRHEVNPTDSKLIKKLSRATAEKRVLDPDRPGDLVRSVNGDPLDVDGFDAEDFEYTKKSLRNAVQLNEVMASDYSIRGQFKAADEIRKRTGEMREGIDRLELAQKAKGLTLDREWTDQDQLDRDWRAVEDKTMSVRESRAVYSATSDDVSRVTDEINGQITSPVSLDSPDGAVSVNLYGADSGRGEPTSVGSDMMYALTGRNTAYGEDDTDHLADPSRQYEITRDGVQYVVQGGTITEHPLDSEGNRTGQASEVDPDGALASQLRDQVSQARDVQAERIRTAIDDSGTSRERMSQLHPRSIASEATRAETMRALLSDGKTETSSSYELVSDDHKDKPLTYHREHAEKINSLEDHAVADQFSGTMYDAIDKVTYRVDSGEIYDSEGTHVDRGNQKSRRLRRMITTGERARADKITNAEEHNDQARRFLYDDASGSYDSGQRVTIDGKNYLVKGSTITGPTGRLIKPDATLGRRVLAASGRNTTGSGEGTPKPEVNKSTTTPKKAPPTSDVDKAKLASLSMYDPAPAKLDQYATYIESASDDDIVSTFDGKVHAPASGRDYEVRSGKVFETGSTTPLPEDSDRYHEARAVMVDSERARARTIRQGQDDLAAADTPEQQDRLADGGSNPTYKVATVDGRRYVIDEGVITGPTGRSVNPDGQLGRRVLASAGLSDVQDTVPDTWREFVEESGDQQREDTPGDQPSDLGDTDTRTAAPSHDEIASAMSHQPTDTPVLDDHLDELEPDALARNPEFQQTLGRVRDEHTRDTEIADQLYRAASSLGRGETVTVDGHEYTSDQLTQHADAVRRSAEESLGTWESWADDEDVNRGVSTAMGNTPKVFTDAVAGLDSRRESVDGLLDQTRRIIDAGGSGVGPVDQDLLNASTPDEFVRLAPAAREAMVDTTEYAELLGASADDLEGVDDPRAETMRRAADGIARLSSETVPSEASDTAESYAEGYVSHYRDVAESLGRLRSDEDDDLHIAETALGAGNTRVVDHVRSSRLAEADQNLASGDRYGGDDLLAPRPINSLAGNGELLREYGRGIEHDKQSKYGGGYKPGDVMFADTYMTNVFADMSRSEREHAARDMWLVMESHFSDDEDEIVRGYEQDTDLEQGDREMYAYRARVRAQSLRERFIEIERQAVEDPSKAADLAHLAYHDQWDGWDPSVEPNRAQEPEGIDPMF